MINRFKLRNFDNHHDRFRDTPVDVTNAMIVSNSQYDLNKGVTHIVVDRDGMYRIISDVEIAMSDNPDIVSMFSAEYRDNLRKGLMNQPRGKDMHMSDDQLVEQITRPDLEMDERVDAVKLGLKRNLYDSIEAVQAMHKPDSLVDVDPSSVDPESASS